MRPAQFRYVALVSCAIIAVVACVLWASARGHDLPLWLLALGGTFGIVALLLPGVWSWRQRIGLDDVVHALIGAAGDIARGEFRRALVSTRGDRLGELEAAFENMRVA